MLEPSQNVLPQGLIQSLKGLTGFDEAAFVKVHSFGATDVHSIRLNPLKPCINLEQSLADSLHANGVVPPPRITMQSIPWESQGYYLNERPFYTFDPLFHAGSYYVQEASSMFLGWALKQLIDSNASIRALDLCAAPGGKTTLLQSYLNNQSVLVANEVIKSRAAILQENITKWGAENVIVTNNDPQHFKKMEGYFDLIVVDAPCSGSGLFRRDPDAIKEWSEDAVQLCSQRQQRILSDILPSLKENGCLIYSTCSYSKEEDEAICDWLLEEMNCENVPLEVPSNWGVVTTESGRGAKGYRFWPDKVQGEGLFLACFRCKQPNFFTEGKKKKPTIGLSKQEIALVQDWVKDAGEYEYQKTEDLILAMTPTVAAVVEELKSGGLYIKQAGIAVGKSTGKEIIPDPALALSGLNSEHTVVVTLNHRQALQYLSREDMTDFWHDFEVQMACDGDEMQTQTKKQALQAKKGWALVAYKGRNLGWVKLLSNRLNNYYPKEWRILKKPVF